MLNVIPMSEMGEAVSVLVFIFSSIENTYYFITFISQPQWDIVPQGRQSVSELRLKLYKGIFVIIIFKS